MSSRGRAFRRAQLAKKKVQARRLWRQWMGGWDRQKEPPVRWVGHMASTHCVPCSCFGCRYPKHLTARTELRARLSEQEQVDEAWRDWKDWRGQLRRQRATVRYYQECVREAEEHLAEMEAARWPDWPVW